ncbi:MAG: response regulator [Methanomicrobiales archaeon]|nr:response regulator [Methanomicrobiales archaeon]
MHTSRVMEILLIEDNPADVRLTLEAFQDLKVPNHMNVVMDGVEAMEFLRKKGSHQSAPLPDLILLDLNLPLKNGREVLEEIKTDDNLKHIPVVVLTTSRAEEDVLQAYRLHVNCYLTKPSDLDQFFTLIQEIQQFWFGIARIPRYISNESCKK